MRCLLRAAAVNASKNQFSRVSFPRLRTLREQTLPPGIPQGNLIRTSASASVMMYQSMLPSGSSPPLPQYTDHSSFANFQDVRASHLDLAADVDFECKTLRGSATFHMQVFNDMTQTVVLDTRFLKIKSVEVETGLPGSGFHEAPFHVHPHDPVKGSKLVVNLPLPQSRGAQVLVRILYEATEASTGLQWLSTEMTASKKYPFMFSQCQAIHARSVLPVQDSPGAKFTYTAAIRCARPLVALMSAVSKHDPTKYADPEVSVIPAFAAHLFARLQQEGLDRSDGAFHTFTFEQRVPISSYLIALAVGELESREIGARSRVWAEPAVIESAAYEFAETDSFLTAAEAIAGPYVWGRYDMLSLPFSFPYGGMENPTLTFLTPSLLAGDRSLTNVVAHEIAHSWTGNLVTNSSWSDFFLNEGWTVFLERKIIERLRGRAAYDFAMAQGYASLEETVRGLGATHNFTRLVPDLSDGSDPDDAFSRVPYEKGAFLIHYLGEKIGRETFEGFIKDYLEHFKFQVLTSAMFKEYVIGWCAARGLADKIADVDWDAWYFAPGLPPMTEFNRYDTSLATSAYKLADRWHTADLLRVGSIDAAAFSAADIAGWSTEQIVAFLERLFKLALAQPLHPNTTRALSAVYGFDRTKNSEVLFAFLKIAIGARDPAAVAPTAAMLRSIGRMKFVRPLMRALVASGDAEMVRTAHAVFEEMRGRYHPVCATMVAKDLEGKSAMAD